MMRFAGFLVVVGAIGSLVSVVAEVITYRDLWLYSLAASFVVMVVGLALAVFNAPRVAARPRV